MQSLMGADSGKLALLNEQNNMMDMITLRFSESTMYSVGDYALYFNGVFDGLYRFKEAKTTGAWDGSKVEQVSLAGILKQHESAISELNTRVDQNAGDYSQANPQSAIVLSSKYIRENWDTFLAGQTSLIYFNVGPSFGAIILKLSNIYGAAIVMGYQLVRPYYMLISHSQWGPCRIL